MKSHSFDASYQTVFDAARKSLRKLSMRIEETDKERGTIIASTETSFLSWGEDVSLVFKRNGSKTEVIIDSVSPSQLISWGKNDTNEDNIIEEMKMIL